MDLAIPPVSGKGNIIVVTGWREVGKTTFCQQAIDEYQKAGLKVSGLLSPARFQDSKRTGIQALNLAGGESRLLASLVPGEISGLQFGPWTFDPDVFAWGNDCLRETSGTDVLVIDELGPLEFDQKNGWITGLDILKRCEYQLALIVIRPEYVDAFSKMGLHFQTREIPAHDHI
jgi:nucleoside-triphosphatase THEP1